MWLGNRTPATEVPARVDVLHAALAAAGSTLTVARPHDDAILRRVHDPGLLDHLARVVEQWRAAGLPGRHAVPYVFPIPAFGAARPPSAVQARAGWYCYDTMTLVGAGTWPAARAAVDVALSAVDLVCAGTPWVYALCRPPGHHATRSAYGGSCYLNNSAIAAEALGAAGHERVAVVDLDAHHGNGTQEICWNRPERFYGSVHIDPAAGWFPHFSGFADETAGGTNRNLPLPPGAGDADWVPAVEALCRAVTAYGASALVVSLGVDAAAEDSESPLAVTAAGFAAAGTALRQLNLPTVLIQEGGYHLGALGELTVAALRPFG